MAELLRTKRTEFITSEDDEPATVNEIRAENIERENASRPVASRQRSESRPRPAPSSAPQAGSTPSASADEPATNKTPASNKTRFAEPQDAFARETLENAAPLGSDENPIVQYGKK